MSTTSDTNGEAGVAGWVGDLIGGAASMVGQGAAWTMHGAIAVVDHATSPARRAAASVAGEVQEVADRTWTLLQEHPYLGGILAGAAGLGAAMATGMAELAAGLAIGYGAYLMLAKGERPIQAIGEAIALERGAALAPAARPSRPRSRAVKARPAVKRRRGR